MVTTEQELQQLQASLAGGHRIKKEQLQVSSSTEDSSEKESSELVMPSIKFIKKNAKIQDQVKAMMEELTKNSDRESKGKY